MPMQTIKLFKTNIPGNMDTIYPVYVVCIIFFLKKWQMVMTNIIFERLYDVYFIPSILINMKTGYISLGKVTIDYQTL